MNKIEEKGTYKKKKSTSLHRDRLRMPPHNSEAEESVLGSIMLDKDAIIKIADLISPSDFYNDKNRMIYEVVQELYNEQLPLDILNISSRLKEKSLLKTVGGRSYLTELINTVPSASNVVSYAKLVQNKSSLRRLISAASDVVEMGYEESRPIDDIMDSAQQKLFAIAQTSTKQEFAKINSLLESAFVRIDDMHKNKDKFRGVETGMQDIDNLLSGLQKSDLIILAARPAIGKTSFALQIARHAAVKTKAAVGVFSLEMSSDQLVDRMLSAEAKVNLWALRTGNLDEEDDDFQKIGDAMGVLSEAPIHIDDSATANIMEMRTMARRLQSEHGLDLLVIDYLQLMEGRGKSESRVNEISEISRGLKNLAKELNVPILALSQLSRAVESRSPQIPKLSDLRESGSIEQDADIVMFLYREDRENPDTENKNIIEVHVAKHRNGPTGQVSLYFNEESTSFHALDKHHSQ
ncbi:replicative DNA helicase [bacterium]|jgi:replicative DNA helicase|nr:replicative DNA helicase [bacterium]MBT4250867.1 replicative DNA helicase [bacterium]MBT4597580.1 replicative DNA helicase [bacterium]MBT6754045.1 replicative DNA helicase [bacterium]MBT7038075.1 replicative DNA helicase [bacterium]